MMRFLHSAARLKGARQVRLKVYRESGEIRAVDSTTGWNFQQGSRLQWLPGSQNTVIFNTVEDGRAVAVMRNVVTGERSVLPAAIYAISPDGKTSIAPNYVTLAHRWKAYGYPALEEIPAPADQDADGLWQLDLESGKESLFISAKRAAEFEGGGRRQILKAISCRMPVSVPMLHMWSSCIGSSVRMEGSSHG